MKLPDRKLIVEMSFDNNQEDVDLLTIRLAWITTCLRVGNHDSYRQWQNLWSYDQQRIIGRWKIEKLGS